MQFPARVINQLLVLVLFAGALCLVAPSRPATAAEKGASETLPSLSVTAGVLESKIKELETATEVQPEVKTRLVDLYRQALSKLEEVSSNAARAAAFEDATGLTVRPACVERRRLGMLGSCGAM